MDNMKETVESTDTQNQINNDKTDENNNNKTNEIKSDHNHETKTEKELQSNVKNNIQPLQVFSLIKLMKTPMTEVFQNGKAHGLVGLYNLGNTCYMNSALQCLSNTEDLTKYFLLNLYSQEINLDNRLGSKGTLTEAFHELLYYLWNSNQKAINPKKFRYIFAKQVRQFYTSEQQDSHEMLSLLLDNLHEDLNRISNKPYLELKERQENETDSTASERWWSCHKKREDSIIVDLFHGQFKSTIDCPVCMRKNITYDPFMFLGLSIPSELASIKLKCFYKKNKNSKEEHLKCEIIETPIFVNSNVKHLKEQCKKITEKIGIVEAVLFDKEKMIKGILLDEEKIYNYFKDNNEICLYEKSSLDCFNVYCYPVIFKEESGIFSKSNKIMYLSYPLSISVSATTTLKELKETIKSMIYNNLETGCIQSNLPQQKLFSIHIYHNMPFNSFFSFFGSKPCEFCGNKYNTSFCGLFDNGFSENTQMSELSKKMKNNRPNIFLVDSKYYDMSKSTFVNGIDLELNKYINNIPLIKRNENITIYDSFDLFQCQERLENENTWYCDKCKKHQEALKTLEIYRAPKYLIIQFKRFKIKTNSTITGWLSNKKITTFVDYPINNLDIRKYVIGPEKEKAIYDLYGIVEHFGSLSSGHYIALCKNLGRWIEYDDEALRLAEKIVNNNAYLLFYKRREIE